MFSISGVKLTVARAVAEQVLAQAFPDARAVAWANFRRPSRPATPDLTFAWSPAAGGPDWQKALREAVASEAVCHLDDLLLRRSSLGDDPARALALAPAVCALLGWDEARTGREIERLRRHLGAALPGAAASADGAADPSPAAVAGLAADTEPDAPSMMPT
jgi:glycerol-3-phosphate dehydrogenase